MGILFIASMCAVGGVYYMSKVAPRVASRMAAGAASSAGAARASAYANNNNNTWQGSTAVRYDKPYHEHEFGFLPVMSKEEALLILGVEGYQIMTVPVPLIKERHRAMIKGHHSDLDGSPYLATKINEARSVLLEGRKS